MTVEEAPMNLWVRRHGCPPVPVFNGTRMKCRSEMDKLRASDRTYQSIQELLIMPADKPFPVRPEWSVPYRSRMINDTDPGHQGPICFVCQCQYADRMERAASYGKNEADSPHPHMYRHEARVAQWACAASHHGVIRFTFA